MYELSPDIGGNAAVAQGTGLSDWFGALVGGIGDVIVGLPRQVADAYVGYKWPSATPPIASKPWPPIDGQIVLQKRAPSFPHDTSPDAGPDPWFWDNWQWPEVQVTLPPFQVPSEIQVPGTPITVRQAGLAGVPTWFWIVAAGAAVLLLAGGRKKGGK